MDLKNEGVCQTLLFKPHIPVGGRLSLFIEQWRDWGVHPHILSIVHQGYRIIFKDRRPPLHGVRFTPLKGLYRQVLVEEVQKLLLKRAIEPVPTLEQGQGFYSTYFLVPKKSGELRPILNLKPFNRFVLVPKFKMETLQNIIMSVNQGEWLASIDLKDAYLHVPIHPSHYQWLRFAIGDVHYQWRVLPFGLSTSPLIFTKVLAPVLAQLRLKGIHVHPYLDDLLFRAQSPQLLQWSIKEALSLLQKAGYVINVQKSDLNPTQDLVFIGGRFRTDMGMVFLPGDRVQSLIRLVKCFTAGRLFPFYMWLRLLGVMVSTLQVVKDARLFMRPVQAYVLQFWSHPLNLHRKVVVPVKLVQHLQWWKDPGNLTLGQSLCPQPFAHVLTTDASGDGWGGGTRSQVNLQRHVDNPTESLAYKLFRAEGSVSSLTAFCEYPKGFDYSGQDGQFHNGSLPQLQWGNEVAVSQSFNLGTSTVVHSTQDFHKSCSRSGDQQRVGGCFVEKQGSCVIPNNSQSHGMVAEFSSPRSGFSIEGHSGDRSVCLALQSEASQVVQLGSRTGSSGMECVLNSVERIPVCVSSNPLNTEGCSQVEERQSQIDSNSSFLASEPVGFGVTPIISGSSHPTSIQTGLIVSTGSVSSATGDSQPGGLDSVWDSYRARGFSEAVIDTLRAARKSSTQGAYEAQWRVFCRWCRDGGHDPFNTSIEVLLEFFDYLFQQGRAYSTIKGYTSMLTAIRGQIDGYSFANHPLVATFLKGVLRKRPPVKSPVPAWDLDIVLNYLMSQEFEPSEQVSLDLWTLKTVFLLAICSACRCSELQALDRSEQFMIIRRRSLSLRTNLAFLPKVPKADYINREIFLEALPSQGPGRVSKKLQTLCPVRALRIYVEKSAPFRKPSVGQLFISYRRDNLGNPVTKQRIATWLVQLIKKAYVYFEMDPPLGVKAHSTRAMSTSVACERGMPIEDICRAATWAHDSVFASCYRLDTVSKGSSLTRKVLVSK